MEYDQGRETHCKSSLDHPKIKRIDAESNFNFLRKYDAYCTEIMERAKTNLGNEYTTESVRSSGLR